MDFIARNSLLAIILKVCIALPWVHQYICFANVVKHSIKMLVMFSLTTLSIYWALAHIASCSSYLLLVSCRNNNCITFNRPEADSVPSFSSFMLVGMESYLNIYICIYMQSLLTSNILLCNRLQCPSDVKTCQSFAGILSIWSCRWYCDCHRGNVILQLS